MIARSALLTCVFMVATNARAETPQVWLEKLVNQGKTLASAEFEAGSPAETTWKAEVKATINSALDWPELTRRALGRNYKGRTDAERKEFARLLREMVEASYQARLKPVPDRAPDIDIEWIETKEKSERATSRIRVISGKEDAEVQFKMLKTKVGWRIYDTAIDDVSTVRTYRSAYGKIIAKHGFAELLRRMRKKTEDIRAGRTQLKG